MEQMYHRMQMAYFPDFLPHGYLLRCIFDFVSMATSSIECLKYFVDELGFDLQHNGDQHLQYAVVKMAGHHENSDEMIPYIISKGIRIEEFRLRNYIETSNIGAIKYLFKRNPQLTLNGVEQPVLKALTYPLSFNRSIKSSKTHKRQIFQIRTIKFLLHKGASIDECDPDTEMTPFMAAVAKDLLLVAKYLIDKGANLELTNTEGKTAVHYIKSHKMLKLLIANGVNIHAKAPKDGNLFNIFCRAAEFNYLTGRIPDDGFIRKMLYANNIDLNCKDKWGLTPLHNMLKMIGQGIVGLKPVLIEVLPEPLPPLLLQLPPP